MFKMKNFLGKIRGRLNKKHVIELKEQEMKKEEEQKKIVKLRLKQESRRKKKQ